MPPEVTQLLLRLRAGEHGALDELMPIMYVELRRIARAYMSRQRAGHTLQPTALVNEAYIKLFGDLEPQLADRAHFVALMSRVMRQVLVDHARSSGAAKRGGADGRVPLDTNIEIGDDRGSEPHFVRAQQTDVERRGAALRGATPILLQWTGGCITPPRQPCARAPGSRTSRWRR